MTHRDVGVKSDCLNPDSYGEICVKCNCCGRFNEDTKYIRRYNLYWQQLAEDIEKHSDEFYRTKLQQFNLANNIFNLGKKILECVENIDFDNDKPEIEKTETITMYCLRQEIECLKDEIEHLNERLKENDKSDN